MRAHRVHVPRHAGDRVAGLLMLVGDRLRKVSDARYTRWRLTESHYNVLRILNGEGRPLAQVDIAQRLLYSRASVTKLMDRLAARGFVRRTTGRDRRTKLVAMTATGRRFLAATIDEAVQSAAGLLEPLGAAELARLERLLTHLLTHNAALSKAAKEPER